MSDNNLEVYKTATHIIATCFESAGIKTDDPYKTLKEGLSAEKVTYDKYGDERREPDYIARHKYMTTALELMRHLGSKDEQTGNTNITNNIITSPEVLSQVQGLLEQEAKLRQTAYNDKTQKGEIIDVSVG